MGYFAALLKRCFWPQKGAPKWRIWVEKPGFPAPKWAFFTIGALFPQRALLGTKKGIFTPQKTILGPTQPSQTPNGTFLDPKRVGFFFSPCAEMGPFCPKRSCGPKMEDCGPAAPSLFLKTSFLPPKWASLPPKCTFFISWSPK